MELYKVIINYSNSGNPEILDNAGQGITLDNAIKLCGILFGVNVVSIEIRRIDK